MIHCHLYRSGETLVGFAVNGHDEADDQTGISLLCASVSSVTYYLANTLTDVCHIQPLVLEVADGLLTLRLSLSDAKEQQVLLQGFALHMTALAGEYPQQLSIYYSEV